MGKLKTFQISLNKRIFQAGETLQGNVLVELNDGMKMRAIRLRFYGRANVHWTEEHTTGTGKDTQIQSDTYSANETYFDNTLVLFGKPPDASGDNPVLPAGTYNFPFHYQLPTNLPSSFEGSWGRVRYWLKCNIDKPWKFDHNCKAAFTVLSILDLNKQPNMMQPQQGQANKTLCCLCCKSGPITGSFWIDRKGYVPGEYIQLNGEVDNKTNRRMKYSKVILRMLTTFKATTKSRLHTQEVAQCMKGEIPPGETEIWSGVQFHIPPLPPTNLVHCNIIDICFMIVLVISPSGPAFDLEVPLEVIVGTVPLRNVPSAFANSAYDSATPPAMPSAPIQPSLEASAPPPPSYAECVTGKVDIREDQDNEYTQGQLEFAPQYTYYNWGTHGQPS